MDVYPTRKPTLFIGAGTRLKPPWARMDSTAAPLIEGWESRAEDKPKSYILFSPVAACLGLQRTRRPYCTARDELTSLRSEKSGK